MTSAPPGTSLPQIPNAEKSSLAIPLIVWLLVQLAALALAASGVRLSANYPSPPQSLAVHEMLIAQFVGAAVLLPVLFRGWRAWMAMVVTAGPMLIVASRLTPVPMSRAPLLWLAVAAWLTTLALWRQVAPGRTHLLAAAATFFSAGGLLVWYLAVEFQARGDERVLATLPLAAALRFLGAQTQDASPLLSTGILSAAAIAILAVKPAIRRSIERPPQT